MLPPFILFNHSFFVGLFFLIAGYFTPPSYDRKGTRAFLMDRLVRLGVPLLAFIALLGPLSFLPVYRGFPSTSHIAQYAALFVIGTIAYRRNWLVRISDTAGRAGFGAAVAASVILWPLAMTDWAAASGGITWQAFIYATWKSIVCVGLSLGLLAYFRQHVEGRGVGWRSFSKNANAVFALAAIVLIGVAALRLRRAPIDGPHAACERHAASR